MVRNIKLVVPLNIPYYKQSNRISIGLFEYTVSTVLYIGEDCVEYILQLVPRYDPDIYKLTNIFDCEVVMVF